MEQGLPVRVIRGWELQSEFAPPRGYRYDGLYYVADAWQEGGKAGFLMCRYRLRADPEDRAGSKEPSGPDGTRRPNRIPTTVQRIVRSTEGLSH